MYFKKTGNNVSEQSLASISIRVQTEPKVIVHLQEMSIFRVPVHKYKYISHTHRNRRLVAICATSHKGHNTKNEAVLLFVA